MKTFIKFGLGTGIISGLWGLVSFTIAGWLNNAAFHGNIPATQIRSYSGLFSIIILALGIYLGLKQARTRNGNSLTYGQAAGTGALIAVVTAVVVGLFTWLYCTVINPGYTDFMVQNCQRTMTAAGKSPVEIAQCVESTRKEFSTGSQVAQSLIWPARGRADRVAPARTMTKKRTGSASHFGYNSPQFGYILQHTRCDICVMNLAFKSRQNIKNIPQ